MTITAGDRIRYLMVMGHPGKPICAECLASKLELKKPDAAFATIAAEPGFLSLHGGCGFCAQIKQVLVFLQTNNREQARGANLTNTRPSADRGRSHI